MPIATPTYDFHVWAWEARNHERMVFERNARDAAVIRRRLGRR